MSVLNRFLAELDKGELEEAKLKRWQNHIPADHFDEMMALAGELGQTLPRYAVIGILKAGKSTLLNCLPVATHSPPVWCVAQPKSNRLRSMSAFGWTRRDLTIAVWTMR